MILGVDFAKTYAAGVHWTKHNSFVLTIDGVKVAETTEKHQLPSVSLEWAYFYNTHRFDLGGKWNVAKPLGGSTRWGHMTGGLTNHLSDLNPYINSCGLGLMVFGLLSV